MKLSEGGIKGGKKLEKGLKLWFGNFVVYKINKWSGCYYLLICCDSFEEWFWILNDNIYWKFFFYMN